jgi:hypothetical protein
MRLLSLTDVSAISGPERDRLREADDAVRDVLSLIDAQAIEDGLNAKLMSLAMVDLLLLAAARLAVAAQPDAETEPQPEEFAQLARQALDWARTRATPKPGRGPR